MIVRAAPHGVHLITQPDHARAAGQIMAHCVALASHPRRQSILHAIREHDNGWSEEDAAPAVNPSTGQIADFITLPVGARQAVWPRGVGRLADPWAAALVAHHAVTVYDRFRSDDQWTSFFAEMEGMRDARAGASSFDDLLADYSYLRLGDLISLAFCTGAAGEQRFGAWSIALKDTRVVVAPDPFGGVAIPIEIEARAVSAGPYAFDAQLRTAVRDAETIIVRGLVTA